MQRLLRRADWDVDGGRDDVRSYMVEHLGDPSGVLIADETGFINAPTLACLTGRLRAQAG